MIDPTITDHAFEHPKYDSTKPDIERFFADVCSWPNCGRPEIEHWWTVDAYQDNKASLEDGK